MASLPSNLLSSRNSDGSDLVSLSSSESEEDSTSDADCHRSSRNSEDILDVPPRGSPVRSSPRQRNSASQGSSVAAVASSLVDDETSISGSPATVPQQLRAQVTYELFDPDQLTDAEHEDKGLLFAKSSKTRFNIDLLQPADEVAEEAGYTEGEEEPVVTSVEIQHVREVMMQPTLQPQERRIAPIDPGVLLELESSAKQVAGDLVHVMENLRNSLHAMTVCTKQSMQLHKESVDNLHTVVDTNMKAMYSFMAKFDELRKSFGPLQQLAQQINEMDENLKLLERAFVKT